MSKQVSTLLSQQVLDCWYKYISLVPITKSEVLDEYLCFHKHIKTNYLNNQIDTIEQHLFLCKNSTKFLKNVKKLLEKRFSIKPCFTICEIILKNIFLKIHIEHDTIINLSNYIIILGKLYINNCRINGKTIQINEFQEIVKRKLKNIFTLKPSLACIK